MRRVRPRQDVKDIKENIVIHKIEKIKGQVVSVRNANKYLFDKLELQIQFEDYI